MPKQKMAVVVCCSVLQCVAAWCVRKSATIISIRDAMSPATHCITRKHTATRCSNLHHTAAYCNTLQRTATHCNTLQRTATHCNTLQHTATHGNALQQLFSFAMPAQHQCQKQSAYKRQWLIQFLKNHLCNHFIQ